MATRTIPLAVYATDGTLYTTTATPPTITVQYGSGAASATTVTQRGNGWSVAIDDTQDALLLISGTGITADHLVVLRFPTQLDANVSSRSTYAGADTAGTTTLLSRLTGTRAGFLDQLEHVADHLDTIVGFGAPPSAATIAAAVRDLATSGLSALKTLLDAIKAKTDSLTFTTPSKVDASAAVDTSELATNVDSILTFVSRIYKYFFNRRVHTNTQVVVYADDGTTPDATMAISGDTSTVTKGAAS